MKFVFTTLSLNSSKIDEFDCGENDLNVFFKNLAFLFQQRHFGGTFVCHEDKNPKEKIIGYYTLCPASIQREVLPERLITGPKPNPIPGFRFCRLAVDKQFQGKGFGKMMFMHALEKCLEQATQIGGSVILIDAKNEKIKEFYQNISFVSLLNHPLLLIQTIKSINRYFQGK